ncbi:gliding motility-associated C-terminal domain-containing protein [Edaphocola aurantiacus]|uniref:gliding motility-associated C-terminal domain-containing protein n=1 Tax=Edaphocola aurantiacus TaxID=2601682 RepID=UPI001C955CB9|nr:gliding motility-associated C-terminal domain-containing protein [Edaphocola aurantiacus]
MNRIIRIKSLILLFLLCGIYTANAQGENNHWHFGYGHHINFNMSPPAYAGNSNISTFESSTAVSDAQGNLLFYTIGCRIWDRNGNEMPNATNLLGNYSIAALPQYKGSGSDCVQTLPNPANPNQYYIFSVKSAEEDCDKVYYHMVDMTLNGGLGDVIPATKNTLLFQTVQNGLKEHTTVTYGACNSYWFIATGGQPNNFAHYAFKIDASGISATPVISTPSLTVNSAHLLGQIKILPQSQVSYMTTNNGLIRANFNKVTGVFSNFELIPNTEGYRFEYAPNEQLMYVKNVDAIKQYNLSLYPNLVAIGASATTVGPGSQYPDMRLAPDGKIYVVDLGTGTLARIEQPNLSGTACTYTPAYITLQTPPTNVMRLGAACLSRKIMDTVYTSTQTVLQLCPLDTITLHSTRQNMQAYEWSDGSTGPDKEVSIPGVYWVKYINNFCESFRDSFVVKKRIMPALLNKDTAICAGKALTLNAYQPELDHYLWSDGSTGPSLIVYNAGTYIVKAWTGHCQFTDTIQITTIKASILATPQDTIICSGSALQLFATTNMGSTIRWNTGQTGPSITINRAGVYQAYTENECGTQADSVHIEEMNCNCKPITPNAFTPNGDGRNDIFLPVFNPDCDALYYELKIYNRYGQLVYMTNRKGTGWDGTYSNNRLADAGVYFYTISLTDRYGDTDKQLLKGDITLVR